NVHSGIICENGSEFTINYVIVNGNKTSGFQSRDSHGQLTDVIIKNNLDGGLRCDNSTIGLANVTITGNQTANKGGGIYLTDSSIVHFDPEHLCNIYLNKAGIGRDLFSQNCPLTKVYLDTFTVAHASNYFATPIDNFDFSIQYGKITQVHEDLYVSPNGDGSDEGISPEHPLKTIDMALTKIVADSLQPRTIYLSEGIYSRTNNNEFFPSSCRSYVTISGAGEEYTILDAEGKSRVMNCFYTNYANIQYVTLKNGYSTNGAGACIAYSDPKFSNVYIEHNAGIGLYCDHSNPKLYRTVISDNQSSHPMDYGSGGGIYCYSSNPELINVTITQNGSTYFYEGWFETSLYFSNSSPLIINSIIWDNAINELYCKSDTDTNSITITYSNIQGGDSSIVVQGNMQINWLDGNINSDPLFKEVETNDYSLLENSPCINAGTALFIWQGDTLLILPDSCYVGNAPDMGAIESVFLRLADFTQKLPTEFVLHRNYPNPFNSLTIISFQMPKEATVNLNIYNTLGQKVKTLINKRMNPGNYAITWDASQFSSGVYIYKLTADNYSCCGKCLLLK
ncbi:MAG: T9SS type A sorting domain-containing protein, partial [Candidatus Marinimicrobia bacterium]|nr:T9SS type A sorting domain-containing protein [Candidatus Neomarinimicrobiota bacterium]